MKIMIVGGKLQGVEATYLARQAGWETILVDKDNTAPAVGMCDKFYQLDVIEDRSSLKRIIKTADIIIPALENKSALRHMQEVAMSAEVPLAFDEGSYSVSSSKIESDKLFREYGIPAPVYWPEAKLPVIVKPSAASGSHRVVKINTKEELDYFLRLKGIMDIEEWVIQEYLSGFSYSLEVVGLCGTVISYQVTKLEMDANFDCKRVIAPAILKPSLQQQLREIAARIAQLINLTGIMDIEVIVHQGMVKVLEIDARLPSQTPTVVWQSTGINMLEHLSSVFMLGKLPGVAEAGSEKSVICEHVKVSPNGIESLGEHIMAEAGPLHIMNGFWGSDEALTNYVHGYNSWVSTLIFKGCNRAEVWAKRTESIRNMQKVLKLPQYIDSAPLM